MTSPRTFLSTMWIFMVLNYLYCDLLGLYDAGVLRQILDGSIGDLKLTEEFLLGGSLLMEIPISMVILSRIIPFRINRWANIVAAAIMIMAQLGSLFVGDGVSMSYAFFSVVEIGGLMVIIGYSWRWREAADSGQ